MEKKKYKWKLEGVAQYGWFGIGFSIAGLFNKENISIQGGILFWSFTLWQTDIN